MKYFRNALLYGAFTALLSAAPLLSAQAGNTKTTVDKVSGTITLSDDVDYIVTDATPFTSNGVVNIANTEHAVLILDQVKPSAGIRLLGAHVQIDGQQAVVNQNCQVKIYNRGCIILPYGNSVKPLTVYSEQNFGGEAVNDFGLENSGGFMNTLSAEKLNNRIRSFKLKRGYMVTFANRNGGRGYSRCFIAADEDLEVAKLPGVLDRSISSYRIFKWYDTGKQALANDTRSSATSALNVTSCYSFGLGENRLPDVECVPHHIYEDWPSAAACGAVEYSPHLKTNNEPGNSADDHPQSVETILDNWENLMRTGMRLCSPSSHDGSLDHLRNFLDAVDDRGDKRRRREDVAEFRQRGDVPSGRDSAQRLHAAVFALAGERRRGQDRRVEPHRDNSRRDESPKPTGADVPDRIGGEKTRRREVITRADEHEDQRFPTRLEKFFVK